MSTDHQEMSSNEVVQRILTMCKTSNVKLRSLALCVPQTWSRRETPIQEYLGPILDSTVATEQTDTHIETTFALEAQAQAQHLIAKYFRGLRNCDELMVLDFGGHSMVFAQTPEAAIKFYMRLTVLGKQGGSHCQLHWGSGDERPRFHAPPGSDFGKLRVKLPSQ